MRVHLTTTDLDDSATDQPGLAGRTANPIAREPQGVERRPPRRQPDQGGAVARQPVSSLIDGDPGVLDEATEALLWFG